MKPVENFLAELSRNGVRVWEEDGALHYSAPKGVVTAETRAQLLDYKAEILDILRKISYTNRLNSAPTFQKLPPSIAAPLSFAQSRLWFLYQLQGKSGLYNVHCTFRIKGELSVDILEASLNQVIRRHEILRTRFVVRDKQPRQEVAGEPESQ